MKKIYTISVILLLILVSQLAISQRIGNLDGIFYQAVAIDENGKEIVGLDINGKPLYNKEISVKFTITKGLNGEIQWQETHTTLTDEYGLFSLVIGHGTPTGNAVYSRMLDIPWIDADQFLMVEISTRNDGLYKMVSNQQFMSVPYSFYTDDIADDAITTEKILNETILAEDIATGAVTSSEILDLTIVNNDISNGTINLKSKVTDTLSVVNGGTGRGYFEDNSILVGNGTGGIDTLRLATNGEIPIGVTGGKPVLNTISAGLGIAVTNSPGGITISNTVAGGVQSNSNTSVNPGTLSPGEHWTSPTFVLQQPIDLPPVQMGDILIASADVNLAGCLMNVYLTNVNGGTAHARIAIFNPGNNPVALGNGVNIKILVVK
jgi:hypothetical protein